MAAVTIDGAAIVDIPTFYDEINRSFMSGESWRLGESLDALDDLLYGGFGALHGEAQRRVLWKDHALSRHGLGLAATAEYYRAKLQRPDVFDSARFTRALDALVAGTGSTYFDLVLDVFDGHPDIELILA